MIKDFLPARTTADTGIIIKPGLLSKSKTKAPEISGTQHDHEGTIDTAFIEGYDAGAFDTALFTKTKKYQKELTSKWTPGKVGGASNLTFKFNITTTEPSGNRGEIVVVGDRLVHPDGTEYTFLDKRYNIFTTLEGTTSAHRRVFLMHTVQNAVQRFPTLSTLTHISSHPNIVVVEYINNDWYAVDNDSTKAIFTPLSSDLIIASVGMTPNAGEIDEFYSFMKSFGEFKPEVKTTIYSEEVNTKIGKVSKQVKDESPKYNGELSGSKIEITDGELNRLNNFKILDSPLLKYNITTVESDAGTYTSFSLNSAGKTTPQVACALLPSDAITYYHDGVANLPQINDTVYLDSGGNTVLAGADKYYHGGSTQKAFQVANDGSVTAIEDCSQYDNIPGAPPAPEVAFRAKYAYSQNETAVPIIIRNAEYNATANITASLGASTVQQEVTISNTNFQLANLNLASLPDTTNTEIALSVKLTDAAGNQSTESTIGSSAGDFGKTIPKDTTPISGHSALFVTNFQGSTAQTTNTNGNFYIKVSNLPTTEIVIANAVITSTGGGTSYISKPNLNNFNNGSGDASGWMYLFASDHSLNNGTVSVVVTLTDAASNVSLGVSDTVSFQYGTASMNPSTVNFGGNASAGVITVTSNTSWNLVSLHSWLTLSSSTGSGNASRNWYAQQNYSSSSRVGIINLQVGGSNVDMLTIQQGPYGNCVDPETDITLESGHTKKAKDIRTGDIVRTKHENTMEMLSCIVTKAELIKDTKKLRITYSDRELVCSLGHRIYVDNKSEFIAADSLEIGDTTTGYEVLEIKEIVPGEVVDITVEKAHTYISNGILSHNNK
jgi:uncharacterized protein YggU (UPF0235/DUF167 family)